MSKYLTIFRIILLTVLGLMLPLGSSACGKSSTGAGSVTPTNNPTGKIASSPLTVLSIIEGDVLIMKPGEKEWSRGEAGTTLGVDCKIKTAANGHATLTFFEGSIIELEGNTEIGLAELGMAGTSSTIKLKQTIGETISQVKKLADPASRYEIETPAAVAAVRGTTMYVSVSADGTTIVGNIEGSVVVIVQGVKTTIPAGMHVTIEPGKQPGLPEPGATPGKTSTAVPINQEPKPASPVTPITQEPTMVSSASISISSVLNQQTVFNGDTVTITFTITNANTVPISGVTVNDDKAGPAAYTSGDSNSDTILNPNEIWMYKVNFIIPASGSGVLETTTTVSGKGPEKKSVSNSVLNRITITPLTVQITSPNENTLFSGTITLAGTVNDPSITKVTVDHNGVLSSVSVVNGSFNSVFTLVSGTNTITVTATKSGGVSASDSIEMVPVEVSVEPPSQQIPTKPRP
jgi:hypothetical protein